MVSRMSGIPRCRICFTCQKEGSGVPESGCNICFTCQKEGTIPQQGRPTQGRRMPQRRPQRDEFPWIKSVTVFPTNNCNLRCDYCFIYRYERRFGDAMTMTFETGKRLVQWLIAASGPSRQITIHWFGGEPLVAIPVIKQVTEWAEEYIKGMPKTIKWGMTSNLSLITDEVNEFLKKYNYTVLCSIDGDAKSHNKHRVYPDGSGSWKDVVDGLDRLLTWMESPPTIRWTVSPDTIDSVISGTKYFLEKGCTTIAHEFVYETEWSKKDIKRLERALSRLIPIQVKAFKKDGKRLDFKPLRDGMRVYHLKQRMTDRCGLARGDVGVDVDGNIFRCHRFVDQYEHHLGDIWEGADYEKMKEINKSWSHDLIIPWNGDKGICATCPGVKACNAGCLAVNFDTTGDVHKVPKTFCDLLQMKVRLAGKLRKALIKGGLWDKWNTKRGGQRPQRGCTE